MSIVWSQWKLGVNQEVDTQGWLHSVYSHSSSHPTGSWMNHVSQILWKDNSIPNFTPWKRAMKKSNVETCSENVCFEQAMYQQLHSASVWESARQEVRLPCGRKRLAGKKRQWKSRSLAATLVTGWMLRCGAHSHISCSELDHQIARQWTQWITQIGATRCHNN